MIKEECPKFETCNAALCPIDPHPRYYWYSDTEVCGRASVPEWVKVQRKIQKINPNRRTYYTQKMLESIKRVTVDITGIENVGYHKGLEAEWIFLRQSGQSTKKAS